MIFKTSMGRRQVSWGPALVERPVPVPVDRSLQEAPGAKVEEGFCVFQKQSKLS